MWLNIALGFMMITATTIIHAGFMVVALRLRPSRKRRGSVWKRLYVVGSTVHLMFVSSLVQAALWALVYLRVGAIAGAEPALYFSAVTLTTLGYGDVVLDENWRLLASIEAANGVIMFGWTTAVVVTALQHMYAGRWPDDADSGEA